MADFRLKVFYTASKCLSFTKAAGELSIYPNLRLLKI
ncbi:hypothetical protein SAMN05421544_10680 [Riemerella columbipharyngis]|uniref:Regulatory helix-turn-helix protein, lysR family n=1 Tax=Riemerella columbipharyngis TaxID=1071918 RepID=A0A1G7BPZ1_9FLAO|nr:hypothetical protein SAMN05421544_10680 [Riemerella columbipharyngis]